MATTKRKQAAVTNFLSPAPKRRAHEEPPSGSLDDNEVMQLPHSPVDQETGPPIESEALTGEAGALTRVTVVVLCVFVCLSVYDYSRTTCY